MDLDLNNYTLIDFLVDPHWNGHVFKLVFGEHINSFVFHFGSVNLNALPHWVWFPKASNNSISNMVYKQLVSYNCDPWMGWKKLWALKISPRVEHFLLVVV